MVENEVSIESKANKYNLKAKIYANSKLRKVIISNWANCFTEQELLPFKNWLEDYLKNNKELLTIEFDNVWDSLPFIEAKEKNYIIKEKLRENIENPLSEILKTIPLFHFCIKEQTIRSETLNRYASGYFPKIKGNIETGIIEISGEMLNSYSLEFMYSFFCWLEILFQRDVTQIHVYLKIGYLGTSYMRRLAQIATSLSNWSAETGKPALWTWYYLDEDIKEWLNDIFKMSDNLSHLTFEAIELDEKQWDKLLK